ncbi:hypothetical protein V5H98_08605 [Georgenia sp. M64]|uniref:hypothetical protein n=1 Tax=Georgenia sp. M64 TaxID=3120520 RepID=UPI0030DEE4F8
MIWWLVWALLVLGALAALALTGLWLWRRVKALGAEVSAAGQLGARLADAGEPPATAPHVPGVTGDPAALDRARATHRRVRAARAARRRARLERATARWRGLGLVG